MRMFVRMMGEHRGMPAFCARPSQRAIARLHIQLVGGVTPSILSVMKVKVVVTPKAAVLDPQGTAVREAMQHLGMPEVREVRIGKYLEIELDGDGSEIERRLHGLCRDLLSNPVIEDYKLEKE
jgi:phosphoribosylformylglycinamidine synthase subunit PurS